MKEESVVDKIIMKAAERSVFSTEVSPSTPDLARPFGDSPVMKGRKKKSFTVVREATLIQTKEKCDFSLR